MYQYTTVLGYRLVDHKSICDIQVDLIITNLNTLVRICCRIRSNDNQTDNYFCKELGITGIETTLKIVQLNGSNIWKVV